MAAWAFVTNRVEGVTPRLNALSVSIAKKLMKLSCCLDTLTT